MNDPTKKKKTRLTPEQMDEIKGASIPEGKVSVPRSKRKGALGIAQQYDDDRGTPANEYKGPWENKDDGRRLRIPTPPTPNPPSKAMPTTPERPAQDDGRGTPAKEYKGPWKVMDDGSKLRIPSQPSPQQAKPFKKRLPKKTIGRQVDKADLVPTGREPRLHKKKMEPLEVGREPRLHKKKMEPLEVMQKKVTKKPMPQLKDKLTVIGKRESAEKYDNMKKYQEREKTKKY